jgi:uncharacterized membrane-anchored protein
MKTAPLTLYGFISLAMLQLFVPISMIARREATLKNGQQLKFKTAPVDPYDAFRGRYVALRIEQSSGPVAKGSRLERGQRVYVILGEDEDGFAVVRKVTASRPEDKTYIKTTVRHLSGGKAHVRLPFDRYYMNEKDAPGAERVYRQHSRRTNQAAHVVVRVASGFAVLEELYVKDKPILEFMEEQARHEQNRNR